MAMSSKDRSSKSLCEKSMKMVANIIRLSFFSIARMSLGAGGHPAAVGRNLEHVTHVRETVKIDDNNSMPSQSPGSRRSQQPQSSSRLSYLIEPDEKDDSSHVIREELGVDGRASAYIRRVHEKNRSNYDAAKHSPLILPSAREVLLN